MSGVYLNRLLGGSVRSTLLGSSLFGDLLGSSYLRILLGSGFRGSLSGCISDGADITTKELHALGSPLYPEDPHGGRHQPTKLGNHRNQDPEISKSRECIVWGNHTTENQEIRGACKQCVCAVDPRGPSPSQNCETRPKIIT